MNTTQGDPTQAPVIDAQAFQRERALQHLQNVFEGKVDAGVIRHVLSESQWKVQDALTVLQNLVARFDGRESVPDPMKSPAGMEHAQYTHSVKQHRHLSLKLTSKIPLTSDEMGSLPMLSPKTPFVGKLEYPPFTTSMVEDTSIVQAMEALQMYAQQPATQMPPTPDVYILQHSQMAGGGNSAQTVSPHVQPPHPLAMLPHNRMPVTSPVMPVANPMMPVTSSMMPVSSPGSYVGAENTYSSQLQCALLHSPDGTVIPEAQFSGCYPMDKNASFYPSADPFRATQNLYNAQHSGENVSAGWFAPPPEIGETQQYIAVSQAEQTMAADAGQNVSADAADANKACRPSKKIFRTKAYSLNPEEREALENLIEDVIIGGVDDEVMTSDESDSESDDESCVKAQGENKDKDNTGSDGLPKVYPAQLKVAVKHMKNLPPRFLKKIHAAPKTVGLDGLELAFETRKLEEREELRVIAEKEKNTKLEGQKRDIKKKIRNMLDGLDSYVEEHIVLVDEDCSQTDESVEIITSEPSTEVPVSAPPDTESGGGRKAPTGGSSPMLGTSAQRIVLKPNVINCSDLERELLGDSQHAEKKITFSVDAPEFVPRAFTPITRPPQSCVSPAQGVHPPATTSPYRISVPGHNSPQQFSSQLHLSRAQVNGPVHNSPGPAYMIPKVTYPVSTPATVVGMRFQQYPPAPTYNAAAMQQFTPVLQPSFVAPGFGIQDLGANHTGQGVFPVYVSPQCKPPVNPYIAHLSPRSSPKAVRRVIDPNVMRSMGMQPILIQRPMPHLSPNSNARPGDPSYNPLYSASLANMYRHLSPHSSPKVQRRGAGDGEGEKAVAGLGHKIYGLISSGKKVMVILRGLPGSGKTTLARELQGNGVVLSTDNFFMKNGKYEIDYTKLSEAYEWNRQKAKEAMEAAVNPIIIDNANIHSWEMNPYVALALKHCYHVELVEPPTKWRFKPSELAEKNIHHVSVESLQRMWEEYEHNVTVESIMRHVATKPAKPASKDEPVADQPLSEDATDPAQGKKPGRRRKRKRRKRKRKTAEGDKANEGESSDEDSAAEGGEIGEAEEWTTLEKCEGAEGNDQQGNLQCPPCHRQGGHVASLAALAKAQLDHQLQDWTKRGSRGERDDMSVGGTVEVVSETHLVGQPAHLAHASCSNQDTDVLLRACCEALKASGFPMELDENGNNAGLHPDSGGFLSKEKKVDSDKEDETLEEVGKLTEALMDADTVQSEQPMVPGSRKKVTFSLQLLPCGDVPVKEMEDPATPGGIRAERSSRRQPDLDDRCEMSDRGTKMLSRDGSEPDIGGVDGDSETVCLKHDAGGDGDLDHDVEVAEITASASFSSQSDLLSLEGSSVLPDNHSGSNIASQDCTQSRSDEDKGGPESVDMSHESAAKTDDEKWTEMCVKSEVTHGDIELGDRARQPRQRRRRRNSDEKINILMVADQLDLGDLTSWKSLTEVVSAPVTPVARGHPGFHRFCSYDTGSSEQQKFSSLPPGDVVLLEEELSLSMSDVETYTCPKDFALLQKIMHTAPESSNTVPGCCILCCTPRVISDNTHTHKSPVGQHTHTITLDKGCMTDDLLVVPPVDGVEYLHSCFPEVSMDDLSYMLSTCGGDIEWAANMLLDSGYEYKVNTPNGGDADMAALNLGNSTDVAKENHMSVDVAKGNRVSVDVAKENCVDVDVAKDNRVGLDVENCGRQLRPDCIGASLPIDEPVLPSLFCLCLASLAPDILSSLQEIISDNDMARLFAVRHFNERHSKITELAIGGKKRVAELSSDRDAQDLCISLAPDVSTEVDKHVEGGLVLELSDTLAAQLVNLFGPVDINMSNGVTEDALLVHLDTETARRLHELWASSVEHRKAARPQNRLLTDEELACRILEEEDQEYTPPHSPQKHPHRSPSPQKQADRQWQQPRSGPLSLRDLEQVVSERVDQRREGRNMNGRVFERRPDSPPASLKEIMEEEEALHLSRKEYEALQSAVSDEMAISTKLKRQKLLEMFPYVDPTVLIDVFKSSQYHLETTSGIIQELFSPPGSPTMDPSSVFLGSTLTEEQLLTWPDELDGQTASKPGQGKYCDEDFRSDAAMHYRLRLECFEKARDAYRRRMMDVAAFYSQQGHVHTQKMKAANEAAAEKILQHRNPRLSQARCVDLHGLHVAEALNTLVQLLADRGRELRCQPDKRKRHLLVMTGKGNHSHGGVARIRPTVIDYLKRNNYRYTESQPGLIKILLKYRDID